MIGGVFFSFSFSKCFTASGAADCVGSFTGAKVPSRVLGVKTDGLVHVEGLLRIFTLNWLEKLRHYGLEDSKSQVRGRIQGADARNDQYGVPERMARRDHERRGNNADDISLPSFKKVAP